MFTDDYAISREFNKQRLEAFLKEHPEIQELKSKLIKKIDINAMKE